MKDSLWSKTAEMSPRPPLPGDRQVEAVVIGGGLAGILTAYRLTQRGIETMVLEAGRVGDGQTRNTTAKITAQHGQIYARLTRQLGAELAGQYARANQRAVEDYRQLVRDLGISCQLETSPAYLYTNQAPESLRREAEAARRLGLDAVFTTETDLPFPVTGAVRLEGQAQFHPLQFLRALAERLTVYEQTPVLRVEGETLHTGRGTVTARHIVFATHYPFPLLPGMYFARMHQERSYVLALEGAAPPAGMYLGVDPGGLSFRPAGDLVLLGGSGHRTGENRPGGQYGHLETEAAQLWPGCRVGARWSAQDCMTLDGVPYIGPFAQDRPSWYVATGFGKWGMTSSMVAANLIADLIAQGDSPDAQVFSPQRFKPGPSAHTLLDEGLHAVGGLSRSLLAPPRAAVEALPPGHGGVVEHQGQKLGVYKDPEGGLHVVYARCPHLGCQLEWNPEETSWDCPCHGSRFDLDGALLDGPAQRDISRGSGKD